MRILCTVPGRYGDILWALPTVRAIAEAYEQPVDLCIGGEFGGIVPLLLHQPYVTQAWAEDAWQLTPPDEWKVPVERFRIGTFCLEGASGAFTAAEYDRVFELGYRGWPEQPLPLQIYAQARRNYPALQGLPATLDMEPWITVTALGYPCEIVCGFTETWFELKVGLLQLLERRVLSRFRQLTPAGSRWMKERVGQEGSSVLSCDWLHAAATIRNSDLFLGDCSALHVLAVALGKSVVLVEPMEARWNPIFYPLGMEGRVKVVTGNDGKPSFDARHVRDTIVEVLRGK